MRHLIRIGLSMPLDVAIRKAVAFGMKRLKSSLAGIVLRWRCPYPPPGSGPRRRLAEAVAAPVDPALIGRWCAHRFDLLGSGPDAVVHGATYAGFGGHRHGPGPSLPRDWRGAIILGLWPGGRRRAAAILALIDDPAYVPLDWQVDFKSGYRWSVRILGSSIPYGHRPGVDVKLPWELARLQHLPPMALAFALDGDAALVREFGGVVWIVRRAAADATRDSAAHSHISERFCDEYEQFDKSINNDGNLEDLGSKVAEIMKIYDGDLGRLACPVTPSSRDNDPAYTQCSDALRS